MALLAVLHFRASRSGGRERAPADERKRKNEMKEMATTTTPHVEPLFFLSSPFPRAFVSHVSCTGEESDIVCMICDPFMRERRPRREREDAKRFVFPSFFLRLPWTRRKETLQPRPSSTSFSPSFSLSPLLPQKHSSSSPHRPFSAGGAAAGALRRPLQFPLQLLRRRLPRLPPLRSLALPPLLLPFPLPLARRRRPLLPRKRQQQQHRRPRRSASRGAPRPTPSS